MQRASNGPASVSSVSSVSAPSPSVGDMDAVDLRSGTAVVTGGGGGLGELIAAKLADRGAAVLVVDVDPEGAAQVCARIRDAGGRAEPLVADLSESDCVETVASAAEGLGPLAVLVNSAGGWGLAPAHYPDAEPEQWTRVLDLNLVVPMLLTQRLLPGLRGGAVVNVSSSAGRGTEGYSCPEYAVAKAGLIRLTTSLAGLAESHRVRASCVVPGWIGLDRAVAQRAELPAGERPDLVPPSLVADNVVELAADPGSAGRVVVLQEGQPPMTL
jgi:NAD(P)-dependent dehydrogenase (short-subunit alcohol dehydrogenase family)